MNTAEMIAGLREYVGALKEYVEALKNRESVNANLQALFKANERQIGALDWLDNHASAIADELAMLAEEVKHLKPLAEEIVAENARLRAEVERMRQAASSVLSKSYEASAYVGGLTKSRAYWDEYDEMMAPLWIALADAKGGG